MHHKWEQVETVEATEHESGPLEFVDAAVSAASADVRRFRSGSGKRAILLPVRELVRGPVSADGLSPAVTHLLFADPVETEAVTGLLEVIGEPARSVRLAVAGAGAPAGLIADAGRVIVDLGPTPAVSFQLYRVDGGDRPRIAPGPRIGESTDVTAERSKWFGTRHGRPDS